MNCPNPNCNKDVSPEWKLCPFCGYEPKKCSNTKHVPRWLPQEARFCPECGEPLDGVVLSPPPSFVHKESKVSKKRCVCVGDILCTDNSTVPRSGSMAGKIAKGVVFYVDVNNQYGWAVHLRNQGKYVWSKINISFDVKYYQSKDYAIVDMGGYTNTRMIRMAGDSLAFPAIYAVDYSDGWFLPALGQLKKLMDVKSKVNTSLKRVGGDMIEDGYWSSTQGSWDNAWGVDFLGGVTRYNKCSKVNVRSVCLFRIRS